ncbi:hypothetical protein FRC06_003865 [Ceratobasidium sp. 370]|nr:hypothetical protein FRC06_003865 [Ceratobasidium sp. 370]
MAPHTYDQHCRTKSHISRQLIFNYLNAVALTQHNRNGVDVSGDESGLDLGVWTPAQSTGDPVVVHISNTLPTAISLIKARTSASLGVRPGLQLCFTVTTVSLPVSVELDSSVGVQVRFDPLGGRGRFEDRLELVFRDAGGDIFMITRPLRAVVANSDLTLLAPVAPYRRPRLARERGAKIHVVGGGEDVFPKAKYKRRLPPAAIPGDLEQLLSQGSLDQQVRDFKSKFMPENLVKESYKKYWSSLVHAEHVQAKIDLSKFHMDDVTLVRRGSLYELEVPGLAEKRPSVLTGDRINVHPQSQPDGVWFSGVQSALYDVDFILNPVPFRRMFQAVNIPNPRADLIFPTPADLRVNSDFQPMGLDPTASVYNRLLDSNHEQLQAVKRVIELPAACAPSNSASDLIAQRLINTRALDKNELFRLNATWRPRITLPEDLLEYSRFNRTFQVPGLAELKSYRVIVATCSSAALIYGRGVNPGHFTHVFVDEAGQASEPEVMIPILPLAAKDTNIILSGDPKQLGPVIRSPVAGQLGMSTSYLERLMSLPAYDEVVMRGISVVKLLKNFRSHEAILAFPNEQFYRNELVPCASPNITNTFLNWNRLASPGFPVIFEAITGEDMRESTSPSFFNPHEASLVKEYVEGLIPFMATTKQIGIVTPYRAQVRKIRQLLREIGANDIDVGSVENFQGQERQVIILSTVRSNQDFLNFDLKHTLGFVSNKRRLNVAITRAQALLIIVGDPMVLGLDPLWRRFLYFVYQSGGWKGAPFPWDPEANLSDADVTASLAERDILQLLRRADANASEEDPTAELDQAGMGDE